MVHLAKGSNSEALQMKVVTYFRVSTSKQGVSGLGLEAQKQAVDSYLQGKSATVVKSFTEIGSGKRDDNRPELQKALRECRLTGARLVVAKLDRLARSARFLMGLQESAVDFVCADMPEANTLTIGLMANLAEYERTLISERTKAAYAAKKARTAATGEAVRWGNPNISTIRNTDLQAANAARIQQASKRNADIRSVIREIVTESPYKLSSRGIAEKLNDAGYVTASGKCFSHVAVIRAQGKKFA